MSYTGLPGHRWSACVGSGNLRRNRMSVETLEPRQLFDAAALVSAELPSATDATTPGQFLALASGAAVEIWRGGTRVQSYANADADTQRGDVLRQALAAAQSGDIVLLDALNFDMGGIEHVEFPADVTVRGSGKNSTRITSSCPQSVDPASTFELNDGTVVEDLWLEGSLHNGLYQPLVGTQLPIVDESTTFLRRVKITGDSDGVFVWGSSTVGYQLFAYDCDISTNYDAVASLGTGPKKTLIELYNCSITVSQPSGIPMHTSNGVNARSGIVGLYNCTIVVKGDENSIQTAGVWTSNLGTVIVANTTFDVSSPTGTSFDLQIDDGTSMTVYGGSGSGPGGDYISSSGAELYAANEPSSVRARHIFYNDSGYDGDDPESNRLDAAAIATDKTALLPGAGPASAGNIISYSKGINGIAIDVTGMHGSVTADDFLFKVGNDNSPADWTIAPQPKSVSVWNGWGVDGSDRVVLIWDNRCIINQWIEVTMLANRDTGLATPDTFYFGNSVGDSGLGNSASLALVNVTDLLAVRNNHASLFSNLTVTSAYDFNRDRRVDTTDELLVRNNFSMISDALRLIEIAPSAGPPDARPPNAMAVAVDWAILPPLPPPGEANSHTARLPSAAVDLAFEESFDKAYPPRVGNSFIQGLQSSTRRGRLVTTGMADAKAAT